MELQQILQVNQDLAFIEAFQRNHDQNSLLILHLQMDL